MQDIKNSSGKLVCRIDATEKIVEIVHKGICTVIHILDNGTCEVINTQVIK
jgi:hypothetical protein